MARAGYEGSGLEEMAYNLQFRFEKGHPIPGLESEVRRRTREVAAPYVAALRDDEEFVPRAY